ncbi:Ubiquitin carboxyl-terminal hydrolase 47 [Trichoplax sp. H2]|nr:Ubiquitin carboxyl-terminal hydrolase 47 [Trichoplax sp. H2]|eukprot:RDD45783.1 Ubiquitin carboxyl-terminal hydrolase 47 [Trichoplax sp. H2]
MVQMTAVEGADDNQKRFTFIVRDWTAECRDFTINLSASSTNATIYRDVAKMADYDHHSFELWWRHSNKDCSAEKLLDINSEQCLKDSELIPKYDVNDKARIFLALRKKNGVLPIKALNDEVKSHTWKSDSNIFRNNLNEERSRIGYVGLVNHAMTCYLNSLLQTLFMTPEFRNALYRWEFSCSQSDSEAERIKEKSIPYQLQKLYLKMQTSTKRSVETSDVIKSFGWDSSEVWQQHDVQELCRVMFDALEKTFKNTDQADMINQLYQGEMKDYVKCLRCNNESARKDMYQDIPLAVKPFGSDTAYDSIEKAMRAFVEPELLTGSNQYMCEKCNMKCDAHKGLKFTKFPYLLTIQLKRFSFDYHTLQRMKLNDRVTFPYILNLSEFLEDQQNNEDDNAEKNNMELDYDNTTQLNYELFSIMIHSGSAVGGHYYAYIKSFDDNNWYCFNDQSVTQINEQDIEKAYGGGEIRRYYTSMFASSSNAYMLMYRQIDKSRNSKFMDFGNFPPHIKIAIENLKKEEDDHKRKLEYERMTYRFKLFGSHPIQKTLVEKKLEINKDITLREATKVAHKLLELENIVPLDRCRIVKYESCNELVDKSFEGLEEKTVEEAFEGIRPIFELLLEWCHEHQDFQTFKSDDMSIKLLEVNLEAGTVEDSVFVKIPYASKAYELADLTKKRLGLSEDDTIRFAQSSYTGLKLLDRQHDVHDYPSRACRLYIEYKDKEDAKEEFNNSKLFKVLDYHNNLITLHIKMALSQNQKNTTEVTKKIDKRMSLSEFKEFIQPDVGLPTNCFKVCRILGSGSEIEMMSTDETFSAQSSEVHLLIKPGRALEKGDHRVSLSWLDINSDRPVQFFTEEIIKEGSTAREFKSKISQQVNEAVGKEIPLSRIRLRKKGYTCSGKVYLDDHVFDSILSAEEAIVSMNQVPVLVRHWQPSTFTLGPYTEVILDSPASNDLFMKIAEISKLHVEDIVITLGQGTFPVNISTLELDDNHDWYPATSSKWHIVSIPSITVFIYKDKKEKAMELSAAKRDEIRRQENIKLYNTKLSTTSTRKEKSLKIFVDGNS